MKQHILTLLFWGRCFGEIANSGSGVGGAQKVPAIFSRNREQKPFKHTGVMATVLKRLAEEILLAKDRHLNNRKK